MTSSTDDAVSFDVTAQNKVLRSRKRAAYDKETIYKVLENGFLCSVG